MRYDLVSLYLALIVAGGVFIVAGRNGPQVTLVAEQKLPLNHLLLPGDLSLRTDGRQYITRPVEKGELVALSDIGPAPSPAEMKGLVPLPVSAERDQIVSRAIDTGATALVCPSGVQAQVRAVFCADGSEVCVAIVDVAEADAAKVIAADKPKLQKACE